MNFMQNLAMPHLSYFCHSCISCHYCQSRNPVRAWQHVIPTLPVIPASPVIPTKAGIQFFSGPQGFLNLLCLALVAALLWSSPLAWSAPPPAVVVASTGWTGAIAKAAGADEVVILAPLDLKHPPEYDYRPADIARLNKATLLVYAGYEPFVEKLIEASGFPEAKTVQVVTLNEPEQLKQQTRIVAEKLGTLDRERVWEAEFDKVAAAIRGRAAQKGVGRIRVLVQQQQLPFVKWLGYRIVGVFGPGELSPARIMEMASLKPDLIVDNFHNPQGRPIREVVRCDYAELINFPSVKTPSLEALFQENAARLGL
jgi:zinc transport system substrate-binding protein